MKIALDMQSRQTAGSRERGIGRYSLSLAKAMLRHGHGHEFSILLNGVFDRTVGMVKADFDVDACDPRVKMYQTLPHSTEWAPEDAWRHKASEYLRESYIAAQSFDFVHCTSLFESPMDDSSTSWGQIPTDALHGVTLYDLIPYAFPEKYLAELPMRMSYLRKIQELRKADLLLAISDFSRSEAIGRLGIDPTRVVNIAGAADDRFQKVVVAPEARRSLLERFGVGKFIMYTGGIDHRKNIERLIQAYSALPQYIIAEYQLVIVCSVQAYQRQHLLGLAVSQGLAQDRLVMTGYVSDDDLVNFYNLCDLFVFPSWCEGFGLPALEAMQCGAPVVAAGTSSLPEVVGFKDALFDPYSIGDMAEKMVHVLEDEAFKSRLIEHGAAQARKFSWDSSAAIALAAMEEVYARDTPSQKNKVSVSRRPRLAFVSPLPPSKSGISGYSAQLLPFLDRHYEITLICIAGEVADDYLSANFQVHTPQWLRDNAARFDRVVYQFGNSDHHSYMFRLLELVPGTVVLHDFWLSNVLEYIQLYERDPYIWDEHLHYSHGWPALSQRRGGGHDIPVVNEFPCNRRVIDSAVGVIVHSQYSAGMIAKWYGDDLLTDVRLVSSLKGLVANIDKAAAKAKLGLPVDEALICSFGFIHSTKHSLKLAQAFLASSLYRHGKARLVLVGKNADGDYGQEVARIVAQSGGRVGFTGFVSDTDYGLYLQAADAAVQLRGVSRGETSAAALDCLAHDVALVINDNGAFSQIPDEAVMKIPAEFEDSVLIAALDEVLTDSERLERLKLAGRDYLRRECDPAVVAARYRDAIEHFHRHNAVARRARSVDRMAAIANKVSPSRNDLEVAATAALMNFPSSAPQRHVYVDEGLLIGLHNKEDATVRRWLVDSDHAMRTESLRVDTLGYLNAIDTTAALLNVDSVKMPACSFDLHEGDVCLLAAETALASVDPHLGLLRFMRDARMSGARIVWYWSAPANDSEGAGPMQISEALLRVLPSAAAIIVDDEKSAQFVMDHLLVARAAFGSNSPTVFHPDEGCSRGADALRQLAVHGHSDGWKALHVAEAQVYSWLAHDPALMTQNGRLQDGCLQTQGNEGYLVYGPYASVPSGLYTMKILGSLEPRQALACARYEVTMEKGSVILSEGTLSEDAWCLAEAQIPIEKAVRDMEVRIWTNATTRMAFRGYYLALSNSKLQTGDTR